jgi:hypothetical protein
VSAFFCVVFSRVGRGLHRADPPSKESYQMSKWIHKFQKLNSELEQAMMAYINVDDDDDDDDDDNTTFVFR